MKLNEKKLKKIKRQIVNAVAEGNWKLERKLEKEKEGIKKKIKKTCTAIPGEQISLF